MINGFNEKSILRKVANGDDDAFKQLFFQWQPFLASHIYRVTESKELTEEIVQDTFLKIWMTREVLETIENFKAYLVVVSRNQALNALRQLATKARQHKAWVTEQGNPDQTPEPSSIYYSMIDEAIDQLSSRQREIYLLHRHQRLTYEEIASRLNVSRETIKTHLQQATQNITRYIQSKLDVGIHNSQ